MYQRNSHSIDTTLFQLRKLERLYFRVCQTPVPSTGALQLHRKPFTLLIQLAGQSILPMVHHSWLTGAHFFWCTRISASIKSKNCLQQKPEHKFKMKSSIQMRKPHFKVPRPKHSVMKLCPQHQKLSMMCIMWTSTIPCITLRPKYHYAP